MSKPAHHINERVPDADQFYPKNEPAPGTAFSQEVFPQNETIPKLFTPLKLRDVEFKNRIWVSPMCQYSSDNGHATDWHLVHLGQFASGGAGAILIEATAVVPEGRISPEDAGIWTDSQIAPLKRIVNFAHSQGAKVGIQLAHAGRKGGTYTPWVSLSPGKPRPNSANPSVEENGWPDDVVGPSAIPWSNRYLTPKEATLEYIINLKTSYMDALERCKKIGFDFVELHAAHGYLLHQFYSPLSNTRTDQYGGSLENRSRLTLELAEALRAAWPAEKPFFVRISADDVTNGNPPEKDESGNWTSWGIEQSKWLTAKLHALGVDLIDISSAGNWHKSEFDIKEGYQVPLAAALKTAVPDIAVGTVGVITQPKFAEQVLQNGEADVVFLARELIRRPNWAFHAARELGVAVHPPVQYERGWPDLMAPRRADAPVGVFANGLASL